MRTAHEVSWANDCAICGMPMGNLVTLLRSHPKCARKVSIEEMRTRLHLAERALQFYGFSTNYRGSKPGAGEYLELPPVLEDGGRRARTILEMAESK